MTTIREGKLYFTVIWGLGISSRYTLVGNFVGFFLKNTRGCYCLHVKFVLVENFVFFQNTQGCYCLHVRFVLMKWNCYLNWTCIFMRYNVTTQQVYKQFSKMISYCNLLYFSVKHCKTNNHVSRKRLQFHNGRSNT